MKAMHIPMHHKKNKNHEVEKLSMWNHYDIQRVLKNRGPLFQKMINLIISGTCLKRRATNSIFLSTMRQWILSGLFSVAHSWRKSAPPWDCAGIMSLQSSLMNRQGRSKTRQHHKSIVSARKF